MSKPVVHGSVLVRLPIAEVDSDFARDVGEQGGGTVIERVSEGRYRSVSRIGFVRVIGEFDLERAEVDETAVHATMWVRPRLFAFLARRVFGRKRLQRGVDAALQRMARRALGEPEEPEFGPDDFADDAPDGPSGGASPGDEGPHNGRDALGHFRSDAPHD
jgi:hypothetical protein